MPIYEYRCEKGHTFEAVQRMTDEPLETCEVCERPVRRVLQPVAVHFKGKGFYNTDYGTRKRQRETAAAAESKPSSGSDGASSNGSKTDSSSASDSASKSTSDAKSDKPAKPAPAKK